MCRCVIDSPVFTIAYGALNEFLSHLDRRFRVEGAEHGPMARDMFESIRGDSVSTRALVEDSAQQAFLVRCRLWDGVVEQI